VVLGTTSVLRAVYSAAGAGAPDEGLILGLALLVTVALVVPVARAIGRRR